jgi:hypothetical protein
MGTMNNPIKTVTMTATWEEWNLLVEAIICGIGGRHGEGIATDVERALKMRNAMDSMTVEYGWQDSSTDEENN